MPFAAIMPCTSSGAVSMRTKMTSSPALPRSRRLVGVEHDLSGRGAWRRVEALAGDLELLVRVDARVEELVERGRVDALQRFVLGDDPFVHEVECDPHRGLGAALAAARLQHPQRAALDGELEILHVAVVRLELVRDRDELRVDVGLRALQVGDLHRRADPRDDVFALRVAQVLAEQHLLAGVRIASERDAGPRVLAHVAEDHRARRCTPCPSRRGSC